MESTHLLPSFHSNSHRSLFVTVGSHFLRKERIFLITVFFLFSLILYLNYEKPPRENSITSNAITTERQESLLPKNFIPQLKFSWGGEKEDDDSNGPFKDYLSKTILITAKGNVSYQQINEEVFKPNGFEIEKATIPIPILKNNKQQTCDQIFSDWLDIGLSYVLPPAPPSQFPSNLTSEFTLNGHVVLTMRYYNSFAPPAPQVWNQIVGWMNADPRIFSHYGLPGMSVMHSMQYMNVTGLHGCVIGSQKPWVEVIALQNGAASLLTVDYQKITINGTDKVKFIHAYDYAKTWKVQRKFDFVVSFSSIEHSGLQRYGDPQDPIGDIREAQKVLCMLKQGGIFFLGLPRGQDELVYNAHRVYGRIRLAMMFNGFELLHVFRDTNPIPQILEVKDFANVTGVVPTQETFVLRKL